MMNLVISFKDDTMSSFFFLMQTHCLRSPTAEGRAAPQVNFVGELTGHGHSLSMKFIYAYDGLNRRTWSNQPGGA